MQYEIESHKILILQPKCPLHLSFSKPVQEVFGNLKCFQVLCLLFSNKITSIPLFCSFTIHFDITQCILVEFFDGCMKPHCIFLLLHCSHTTLCLWGWFGNYAAVTLQAALWLHSISLAFLPPFFIFLSTYLL